MTRERWRDFGERDAETVDYCPTCNRWTGHTDGDCEVCE